MTTDPKAAGQTGEPDTRPDESAELWDVRKLAAKLSCSTRSCYRLADAGRLPPPTRLGSLVRWNRRTIQEWLDAGCPSVRSVKGGGR
jgi:predicted DNA-binding transcriptional regulator AlpA